MRFSSVPVPVLPLGWSVSSSFDTSHCFSPCVAWSQVLGLHRIPLWTLAISHMAKKSLGGRVNRGGVRRSGMSFHGIGMSPGCDELSVGVSASFLVLCGSLTVFLAQLLKQFYCLCRIAETGNQCSL